MTSDIIEIIESSSDDSDDERFVLPPSQFDLAAIWTNLLEGPSFSLSSSQIISLCRTTFDVLLREKSLLQLEAPVVIGGGLEGQRDTLLSWLNMHGFPPKTKYLWLGNYAHRTNADAVSVGCISSIDTLCVLLVQKVCFPDHVFLLRGQMDCDVKSRSYGFYDECMRHYNKHVWKRFCWVFHAMPVAALIGDKIFCVHSGLSPSIVEMRKKATKNAVMGIVRPSSIPVEGGLMCDLLWAQPREDLVGWEQNEISFHFGVDVVHKFLEKQKWDLVVRSQEVVQNGYAFFASKQLVTIWSSFRAEGNNAAVMNVNKSLKVSFKVQQSPGRSGGTFTLRTSPISFGALNRDFDLGLPMPRIHEQPEDSE